MRRSNNYKYLILTIMIMSGVISCVSGQYLRTEIVKDLQPNSPVRLIMYSESDPINIAIFDIACDDYTFDIQGSAFNYSVSDEITAEEALNEANSFLYSSRTRLRNIYGVDGIVIGYEIRPVYNIVRYGVSDVLAVDYIVLDGKVRVYIDLKHSLKNRYYRYLH